MSLDEGLQRFVLWFMDFYGAQVMAGRAVPRDWVRDHLAVYCRKNGVSYCCYHRRTTRYEPLLDESNAWKEQQRELITFLMQFFSLFK